VPIRRLKYALHPAYDMMAAFETNLVKRTGKTLEQWIEIVKRDGPPTEKERRQWLLKKHGFSTNYARYTAERAAGMGAP